MRVIRALGVAALVALDVSAAVAQPTRHFKDSWFWGLKGGGLFYQVQSDTNGGLAPLAGGDWVITRTYGGLYLSYDRAFFNQFVFVNDSVSPLERTPGGRQVNLEDMHRVTVVGLLFPLQRYYVHPYFGFGATMNVIAYAQPQSTTYANQTQRLLVEGTIQTFKSVASPVIMLGTQIRVPLASLFVQATATPVSDRFFLFTGNGWRASVEAGMRYNVGTSVDRVR